ncbi:MAG: hypothetical protein AAF717_21240 [Bacteroidota bacterium]|nr:hypothetical protein [uncultured Allomuricauda sp.]
MAKKFKKKGKETIEYNRYNLPVRVEVNGKVKAYYAHNDLEKYSSLTDDEYENWLSDIGKELGGKAIELYRNMIGSNDYDIDKNALLWMYEASYIGQVPHCALQFIMDWQGFHRKFLTKFQKESMYLEAVDILVKEIEAGNIPK